MQFNGSIKAAISAVCFGVLSCTSFASASLSLTFTETATATGVLNGVSFTNAAITLSTTVDTSTVYKTGNFYLTPTTNLTKYSIAGLGSGSFNDAVQVYDLQGTATQFTSAGFTDITAANDIIDTGSAVFGTYALQSVLASTPGTVSFSTVATYKTSVGPLNFSSVSSPTFSATAVPEPATVGLISLSALLLRRVRRR